LGNLAELTSLNCRDNALSGTIPYQLGDLAALEHVVLYRNDLTGTLPLTWATQAFATFTVASGNAFDAAPCPADRNQVSGPSSLCYGDIQVGPSILPTPVPSPVPSPVSSTGCGRGATNSNRSPPPSCPRRNRPASPRPRPRPHRPPNRAPHRLAYPPCNQPPFLRASQPPRLRQRQRRAQLPARATTRTSCAVR
jgi:hypothetical protein